MKFKNKGRKIYKTKEKNYYGKSPMGKFLSGALSVLLIGGVVFLGYSTAEPIINYTKKRGDSDVPASEGSDATVDTSFSAEYMTTEAEAAQNTEQFRAASVSVSDLSDIESLKTALKNIPDNEGIEFVSVPLKISGGDIYYASQVYEAQMCGAVKSALTLNEITAAIREEGFKPVAEISLLRDNLLPQTYIDAGYKVLSDGSRWIDNDVENGGKPWTSPFSEITVSYLSAIIDEISASDFEKVICSDVVFPNFRDSDLELLGEEVSGSERYKALTSLVNQLYSRMINKGTVMMLEVSAADLIRGSDDVIQPLLLDVNTLVLNIDFDELDSGVYADSTLYEFAGTTLENTEKAIGLIKDKLSDYNVVVRLSGSGTGHNELIDTGNSVAASGYNSFIIG